MAVLYLLLGGAEPAVTTRAVAPRTETRTAETRTAEEGA